MLRSPPLQQANGSANRASWAVEIVDQLVLPSHACCLPTTRFAIRDHHDVLSVAVPPQRNNIYRNAAYAQRLKAQGVGLSSNTNTTFVDVRAVSMFDTVLEFTQHGRRSKVSASRPRPAAWLKVDKKVGIVEWFDCGLLPAGTSDFGEGNLHVGVTFKNLADARGAPHGLLEA
jgi:hypothetical protein